MRRRIRLYETTGIVAPDATRLARSRLPPEHSLKQYNTEHDPVHVVQYRISVRVVYMFVTR